MGARPSILAETTQSDKEYEENAHNAPNASGSVMTVMSHEEEVATNNEPDDKKRSLDIRQSEATNACHLPP